MKPFYEYAFLVRALAAGLLLALLCGVLSPFIVLRRLSFAADGLAHASLGGLAVGLFLTGSGPVPDVTSYLISFLFTCGVAVAIAFIARRVQSDTAVGACYVGAFALGIALLSVRRGGLGHLEHVLFGSILAVQPLELVLLGVLTGSVLITCGLCGQWLGAWAFDEDLARAEGVPVVPLRYALLLLIAATVIVATRLVGVLLVSALLVLPGATGCLGTRTLAGCLLVSVVAAWSSALVGMAASNATNIPPGPAIVLCAFGCFLAAFAFHRWRDRRTTHAPTLIPFD